MIGEQKTSDDYIYLEKGLLTNSYIGLATIWG